MGIYWLTIATSLVVMATAAPTEEPTEESKEKVSTVCMKACVREQRYLGICIKVYVGE